MTPRSTRLLRLATLLATAFATSSAFAEIAPSCQGKDMLAELAVTDPASHRDVLSQAAAIENSTARFWRIERADLPEPSHLLGTIHLTDDRVVALSSPVETALKQARSVAVELADLNQKDTMEGLSKVAHLLMMTDGRKLSQLLPPDDFKAASDVVTRLGAPAEAVEYFRPWVISMMLAMSECETARLAAGMPVLDMKIAEEATKRGISLVGLETSEQQLSAMAAIPEADQVQMLRAGLKYRDAIDDTLATILQMYLRRQMGAAMPFQAVLAKKAGIGEVSYDQMQLQLLTLRNIGMRDGSLPLIEKGRAFIAVGALHLLGNDGLVTLLRKAGYTLTPIVE